MIKTQMEKLKEMRNDHPRRKIQLLISKHEFMEKDCFDYLELKWKCITLETNEENDPLISWRQSIHLYQIYLMNYFLKTSALTKGVMLAENIEENSLFG